MGTTPTTQIPYVENGDAISGYPTQDKAKADRLEVLLSDTGWVNLTPASGTGWFRYRVMRGFVHIQWSLSGMTSIAAGQNGQVLAPGILPPAYRVPNGIYATTNTGGAGSTVSAVNSDGSISTWNNTASSINTSRGNITYPVEVKP